MSDSTVKKVSSEHSPRGNMGQRHLASGIGVSMRLWEEEPASSDKPTSRRDYETVGYVIGGRAELWLEGQKILLGPGDSWLVPRRAEHTYTILEPFTAVEATIRRPRSTVARTLPEHADSSPPPIHIATRGWHYRSRLPAGRCAIGRLGWAERFLAWRRKGVECFCCLDNDDKDLPPPTRRASTFLIVDGGTHRTSGRRRGGDLNGRPSPARPSIGGTAVPTSARRSCPSGSLVPRATPARRTASGRHDGHEQDVGVERQAGHVDHGVGDVAHVHRRLGARSSRRPAARRPSSVRSSPCRRCRCRSGRRRCRTHGRRATVDLVRPVIACLVAV